MGPDRVTIVERWASVDALRAHDTAAHMLAYRGRVKEYIRGREIRILKPA
jgi:quinol monooxygenase YgiN